jgi:glycosyltransferase involved in cell wall biosynthesis
MPFFSVVTAALDAAATLPNAFASLQEQTFTDWDAIVVDDGSVDDTPRIVQSYAGGDARIRLLRASSRGVSAARNDGIAAATGEWLLFLDADDTIFPGALAAGHRAIQAEPAVDVWCGGWVRVAPGGEVVTRPLADHDGHVSSIRAAVGVRHSQLRRPPFSRASIRRVRHRLHHL